MIYTRYDIYDTKAVYIYIPSYLSWLYKCYIFIRKYYTKEWICTYSTKVLNIYDNTKIYIYKVPSYEGNIYVRVMCSLNGIIPSYLISVYVLS